MKPIEGQTNYGNATTSSKNNILRTKKPAFETCRIRLDRKTEFNPPRSISSQRQHRSYSVANLRDSSKSIHHLKTISSSKSNFIQGASRLGARRQSTRVPSQTLNSSSMNHYYPSPSPYSKKIEYSNHNTST